MEDNMGFVSKGVGEVLRFARRVRIWEDSVSESVDLD